MRPSPRVEFVRGGRRARGDRRARAPTGSGFRTARRGDRCGGCGPDEVTGPGGQRATIDGRIVTITRDDGTTIELVGHRDRVTSVAFSADGTRVVTASADHDARIWDTSTGGLLQVLLGHFAIVSDARFSPDGRWVVTAGPGTAGLWSARSGRLIYLLQGHAGKLLSVAFAPDGRRIATGGEDGTVRLFRCTICGGSAELVALADARLARTGRALTDEERERYGLLEPLTQ